MVAPAGDACDHARPMTDPQQPSSPSTRPSEPPAPIKGRRAGGVLDLVEWVGNKLPDPAFLFLIGAGIVMIASHVLAPTLDDAGEIVRDGWVVQPMQPAEAVTTDAGGSEGAGDRPPLVAIGEPLRVRSLLTSDGLYWCLKSMTGNFMGFPPLGVVLVGILGIGVAERTGLIAALLKTFMAVVPAVLLTPAMVFLGIMSSVGSDAGYIVLPPLAAAIYLSAGRSPLAGIAAVFAGVSAGFNANLLITTLEPIMAEFSSDAAKQIDPAREVVATSTWYFMIASTFLVTAVGWGVSALFVEKRLAAKSPEDGGPDPSKAEAEPNSAWSLRLVAWILGMVALIAGGVSMIVFDAAPLLGFALLALGGVGGVTKVVADLAAFSLDDPREARATTVSTLLLTAVPAAAAFLVLLPDLVPSVTATPLYGKDGVAQRWVVVVVPLMLLTFVLPGLVHGLVLGSVRTTKDAAKLMVESIGAMAPIIVLAFFAGQFIEYFKHSNLGTMLAYSGGQWLYEQQMSPWLLIAAFVGVTMLFNLFVGSMSAKYALFAPIFVPMFMFAGVRPELTMVAYRIGDSVTNVITPLNAYLIIILVYMQKHAPRAGMGTLIAMMLPYTVVFAIVWTLFLLGWDALGLPLGVGDPNQVFAPEAAAADALAPAE
ncbi:MAG: AbgT family transporter [Planctomycetota bacterium]